MSTVSPGTVPLNSDGLHTSPTLVMRPVPVAVAAPGQPTSPRTGARPAWWRWLRRLLIGLAALVLLLVASGVYFWYDPTALGIVGTPLLPPAAGTVPWNGSDRINILAMGVDSRNPSDAPHSDTMIVLSLDPANRKARMVSIPRDLAVTVPGYGQLSKINSGYFQGVVQGGIAGGPPYAAFTVEHSLGVPINYYAVLDFNKFRKLIDALGGVDINVDQDINDQAYPADVGSGFSPFVISKGAHHMDGITALKYVRERHVYTDQDGSRIRHQQQLISALRDKALSLQTLIHLPSILSALRSSFDTNLPDNLFPVVGLLMLQDRNVQHVYLDETAGLSHQCAGLDGGADLCPNQPQFAQTLSNLFHNQRLQDEHATVWMENGTANPYETKQVLELLSSCGFTVAGSALADNNHHAHTAVIVNTAQPPAPYTTRLLRQMFGARLISREMPDVPAQVVLLVGNDAPSIQNPYH